MAGINLNSLNICPGDGENCISPVCVSFVCKIPNQTDSPWDEPSHADLNPPTWRIKHQPDPEPSSSRLLVACAGWHYPRFQDVSGSGATAPFSPLPPFDPHIQHHIITGDGGPIISVGCVTTEGLVGDPPSDPPRSDGDPRICCRPMGSNQSQ